MKNKIKPAGFNNMKDIIEKIISSGSMKNS
jgi:hypothetical protein